MLEFLLWIQGYNLLHLLKSVANIEEVSNEKIT